MEHITSLPRRGVGTLSSVSYLLITMKERPCHVYSDSMPSKQIIGLTVTEPLVALKSSPDTVNGVSMA